MKRISLLAILALGLAAPSMLMAQGEYNHGEVGVFADYMRLNTSPGINFVGVGGRVAFYANRFVALEAEMSYDFARNYTTTFNNGVTTQFATSSLRPLSGLFGPAFKIGGSSPFRAFVTGKVGFINFSTTSQTGTAGFTSAIDSVTAGNTHFAVYPGAGIEGFWGPFGLRLDAGDEMFFSGGTRHNLKVEFGPHVRF